MIFIVLVLGARVLIVQILGLHRGLILFVGMVAVCNPNHGQGFVNITFLGIGTAQHGKWVKHMFKLTHKLPSKCYIACSGGVDSVAAMHFLKNRVVGILHFHHNTPSADLFLSHVKMIAKEYSIPFYSSYMFKSRPNNYSKEQWWREQRYEFLNLYATDKVPVILGHNLNDCLEEYIMNVFVRGRQGTIPYRNNNCIRPFRMWSKTDIYSYAKKNGLSWVEDPSNLDTKYRRNNIRNNLVREVLKFNPNILTIVKKQILLQDKFSNQEE